MNVAVCKTRRDKENKRNKKQQKSDKLNRNMAKFYVQSDMSKEYIQIKTVRDVHERE